MSNQGFIYVLANSSMPNVVKVGKTTRSPAERAGELSGVTGLPTPFIVVYEQLFHDCSAAETFVHEFLEQKGYRVANNREFFSAPVNEVVRAVIAAPGAINVSNQYAETIAVDDGSDELLLNSDQDELDDFLLQEEIIADDNFPWSDIFDEAESYYYGVGEYIQDYAEALRLYKQAARLGSPIAYQMIGKIHENGYGLKESRTKALEFYKEAARKGNAYAYWLMGEMFGRLSFIQDRKNGVLQYQQNAEKCFKLFFDNYSDDLIKKGFVSDDAIVLMSQHIAYILTRERWDINYFVPDIVRNQIPNYLDNIKKELSGWIRYHTEAGREDATDYQATLNQLIRDFG